MSDYDNICEDRHDDKTEREEKAHAAAIEYHTDNWIKAVTQSVKQSWGNFANVKERTWAGFSYTEKMRSANSVDVFLEELESSDFAQRAAQILIDVQKGHFKQIATAKLFDDMANSYAEFQYEKNFNE